MDTSYIVQADSIRDHIIQTLTKNIITNTPFPHIICDNFFPADFARKVDALFPSIENCTFDSVSVNNTQRRYRRSLFNDDSVKTSLEYILDNVFDLQLLKHILYIFDIEYCDDYQWGAHYACDFNVNGCNALPPHVDIDSKVVSLVYYVPQLQYKDGKLHIQSIPGTDLLMQDSDKQFHIHTSVEAKRNRCLIFPRVEDAWHAVKETLHMRRTITAFIVKESKNTTFTCLK